MDGTRMPAIVRPFSDEDRKVEVINTPYDSVSFTRGFGDIGYRIEIVEYDCPSCGFDRMLRQHNVNPEGRDSVKYWCLCASCDYYVGEEFSYACRPAIRPEPQEPVISE